MTETSSHPGLDRNARGLSFVLDSFTWDTVTMRTTFSALSTSIGISHIGRPPYRCHRTSGARRRIKERRNKTAVQAMYSFNLSFKENRVTHARTDVEAVSSLADFKVRIAE